MKTTLDEIAKIKNKIEDYNLAIKNILYWLDKMENPLLEEESRKNIFEIWKRTDEGFTETIHLPQKSEELEPFFIYGILIDFKKKTERLNKLL